MIKALLNKRIYLGKRKGFTATEMLVVLVVLAVLVGLAKGAEWADEYARYSATISDMDTIANAIQTYESMRKDKALPSSLGDLVTGVQKNKSISNKDTGALVTKSEWTTDASSFKDRWDNAFVYDPSNRTITSNNNGDDPIVVKF